MGQAVGLVAILILNDFTDGIIRRKYTVGDKIDHPAVLIITVYERLDLLPMLIDLLLQSLFGLP